MSAMKTYRAILRMASLFCAMSFAAISVAQSDEVPQKDTRPVRNTFESILLIDHQTVMVPVKGTFEFDIQHRFGTWDNGYKDFYGVFAPSNIRLGFDYVPIDRLMVGFGFTKHNLLWDFYGKYAILRQGRSGGSPLSVTYYVNAAVDTRKEEKTDFSESSDRWSFFHELMVARKITDGLSIQAGANLSWFNYKEQQFDDEGNDLGRDKNAHIAANVLARYKFTNSMGVLVGYEFPISDHEFNNPEPNLCFGVEIVTSSHAFQFFVGNYQGILPQYNATFNPNSFGDNEILIGFNMTRLWNF